jgi:CDP-diacylglycerol pyrophosphatase
MMMKKNKHQSSTLGILAAAVAIATILALSVVVLVVQEANAVTSTRFSFNQVQDSRCSGFAGCSNTGTITVGLGGGHDSHP